MKRFFVFIGALIAAASAFAQTPQEIISRMEEEMTKHQQEGVFMIVDVKIPIVGNLSTKTYTLGDKARMEVNAGGIDVITWLDAKSQWIYNSSKNEVEISAFAPGKSSGTEGDLSMFDDITDGYDVAIEQETHEEWHLKCTKSKSNPDKDAPKTLSLVVAKGTYMPVSLTTKVSGVGMTMRDLKFGVSEKKVTFNADDFPDVKIIDKR